MTAACAGHVDVLKVTHYLDLLCWTSTVQLKLVVVHTQALRANEASFQTVSKQGRSSLHW
jgi:hypothetical protein